VSPSRYCGSHCILPFRIELASQQEPTHTRSRKWGVNSIPDDRRRSLWVCYSPVKNAFASAAASIANSLSSCSAFTNSLQRFQEFDNRLLICRGKVFKASGYIGGFAAVTQDGVAKCHRSAIVHQHWLEACSP